MGCGSSSDTVHKFENNEENRRRPSEIQQTNHAKKDQKKKPSSAASTRSIRSSNSNSSSIRYKYTSPREQTKPSSASSKTSDRRKISSADHNKHESARTDRTYTIATDKEYLPDISDENDTPKDGNRNDESEHEVKDTETNNNITHENQAQTLINDKTPNETIGTNDPQGNSKEKHEHRARAIEQIRLRNYEEEEQKQIEELNLVPLTIPTMEEQGELPNYSVDDIVAYNAERHTMEWFKYGKKVYSWVKMRPIIEERVAQYATKIKDEEPWFEGYPITIARHQGVTRKELKGVLAVCHIGNEVDVPNDQYLFRLKQSVDNILDTEDEDELPDTEYVRDYKEQLSRWLEEYPHVELKNKLPDTSSDPNELAFPLPRKIMIDPSVLRKWIESWEEFDMSVPEEGAWSVVPLVNTDYGDAHDVFSKLLTSRVDDRLDDLDMTVDGEAAWNIIEIDLFKKDATTEEQDETWKNREDKAYLNDPKWMHKRRAAIGDKLIARHEWNSEIMVEYAQFCDNLTFQWKEFQELCEKEFVPPRKLSPDIDQMPDDDTNDDTLQKDSPEDERIDESGNDQNKDKQNNENNESSPDRGIDASGNDQNKDKQNNENNESSPDGGIDASGNDQNKDKQNNDNNESSPDGGIDESGNDQNQNKPNSDNNDVRATPDIETMDSGLDLDMPEQYENGNK